MVSPVIHRLGLNNLRIVIASIRIAFVVHVFGRLGPETLIFGRRIKRDNALARVFEHIVFRVDEGVIF